MITRRTFLSKAYSIVAEEQACYYRTLMIDAVTMKTSEELCACAQEAGDLMVARVKRRLDELKAEASR
jgi:hypothetical protein